MEGFSFKRIEAALFHGNKQAAGPRAQAGVSYQPPAVAPFHLSSYVQPLETGPQNASFKKPDGGQIACLVGSVVSFDTQGRVATCARAK